MTQFHPFDGSRQQLQETLEVFRIELLGRRELPDQRTQLGTQLGDAAVDKAFDRFARFRQHAPVGGKARRLD
ncbi:hypothetical protein D3C72_2304300 [compost metagenome]